MSQKRRVWALTILCGMLVALYFGAKNILLGLIPVVVVFGIIASPYVYNLYIRQKGKYIIRGLEREIEKLD